MSAPAADLSGDLFTANARDYAANWARNRQRAHDEFVARLAAMTVPFEGFSTDERIHDDCAATLEHMRAVRAAWHDYMTDMRRLFDHGILNRGFCDWADYFEDGFDDGPLCDLEDQLEKALERWEEQV